MPTVQVTQQNFDSIAENGIVLLDWWASWCGPCRAFGPIFEQASSRHPDVTFGKIDTEAERGLASAFRIRAIPTLMILRDGILLGEHSGVVPGPALDDMIRQVRELDMDEVRRGLDDGAAASLGGGR